MRQSCNRNNLASHFEIFYQSSRRVAAQAGKIALGPVKIRPTGQQNLTKNFQKMSCGPVDLAVQREDCFTCIKQDLSQNSKN